MRTVNLLAPLLLGLALLAPAAHAGERLSLNRATAVELATVQGVDPALAEQIVALRAKRGTLTSVEALRAIPGISDASLDALRESTTVDLALPGFAANKFETVDQVLAHYAGEPTIQQTQAWAADYARTNPVMVDRWLAASRSFAALPELTLEYDLKEGWDQGFFYVAEDGSPLLLADQTPVALLNDAGVDQDVSYQVRAKWQLDKLIMSSERIRVLQEAQDIAKLRDSVLADVTELYFERRRLQVDMLLNPSADLKKQVRDTLQLQELTAGLDALTGGAFSGALPR